MPRRLLLERVGDKDALISLLSDRIDDEVIDAAPELKAIGNYAVGYDNVDVAHATAKGIPVLNTPDVLTDATADIAFGLMIAAARRFGEGERMMRGGDFRAWGPKLMVGRDVWGATLGVVGGGKIGKAVLLRGKGFNMRLLYTSRSRAKGLEDATGAEFTGLNDLLRTSDFVSLNVPLTEATRHLIGRRELSLMKEGAVLVNTSRGPVVDEAALVEALRIGRPGAAGLDVYEGEPEVHPGLLELDNVFLLPHIGSATVSARTEMARLIGDGIAQIIKGKRPTNTVNPQAYGTPQGGR